MTRGPDDSESANAVISERVIVSPIYQTKAAATEEPSLADTTPYEKHIPALDGIRGFAALGVVCSHVFPGTPRGAGQMIVSQALEFGATGVDLFFVLSGFLITGILYDSLTDGHFFLKFYARRALRIFPLYYGVLLVFLVAEILRHSNYNGQLLATSLYLQNTYWIANPIWLASGKLTLPLMHFWSLAIEEQFYLMWPLIVSLAQKRARLLWLCAASFVFCPLLRWYLLRSGLPYESIHSNVFARADSLLAGAALSLFFRGTHHRKVLSLAPWLCATGLFAATLLHVWNSTGSNAHWIALANELGLENTFLAIGFVGLVALAIRKGAVQRLASIRPLRFVGKYSYGIYVYHVLVFTYLSAPLRSWLVQHVSAGKGFGVLATGLALSAVAIAVSYLSYHLIESPFLRLKKHFSYSSPSDASRRSRWLANA